MNQKNTVYNIAPSFWVKFYYVCLIYV